MNIYLLGYMGCGKSKTGRRLASHIQRPFLDLDSLLETRTGLRIDEFFARRSETEFRRAEAELLRETADGTDRIVSLGGGTPCFGDNMAWIKAHGFSVYLKMNELSLLQRLCSSPKKRPLLAGLSADGMLERICSQLPRREVFYLQADLVYSGINVDIDALWDSIRQALQKKQLPNG